jgi:vacuolar-type H+-ATPase subunit H
MDPMEILRTILEADEKARDELDELSQKAVNADEEAARMLSEAREKAMTAARTEAQAERAGAEAEAEKALRELDEKCKNDLAALKTSWEARKDSCVERIFRLAVGFNDE